jgi:YcaO-like protein with predicted kinase domain
LAIVTPSAPRLDRVSPDSLLAREEAGDKRYRDGTHRTTDPDTTLQRLRPLVRQMGVTRVGILTGLDVVGIPVAAAYRPNSRTIAVHQGKGPTLAAARVSAIMEAVECFHAESPDLSLRLAMRSELLAHGRAVDPERLPRVTSRSSDALPMAAQRLLWAEAQDLLSGGRIWVPYELVSADYSFPQPPGFGVFQATTNGLGAGNTMPEAILHGLCEAIERDATALWHAAREQKPAAPAVEPATVDGGTSGAFLARFAAAGVAVRCWDVTSDIGIPAFLALVAGPDDPEGVEPELGSGCHPHPDVALARALVECAQARLTRISGARDDFPPESYDRPARLYRHELATQWLRTPARVDFRHIRNRAGPSLQHDIETVLRCLDQAGFDEAAFVDLSRPDIGLPVTRIIVPGLEGSWEPDGPCMPGPRARAVR